METSGFMEDGISVVFRSSPAMVLRDSAFFFFFCNLASGGVILLTIHYYCLDS